MALVTTVTPTVSTADHVPGIPDDGDGNIAGEFDLGTVSAWGYVASFASPSGLSFSYDSSGPTFDIGQGRVYRMESDEQKVMTVSSESGISLNVDTNHYVFFTESDEYEVHDADEPPSGKALLIGIVDTDNDTVNENTRGRSPVSQFNGIGRPVTDTEAPDASNPSVLEAQDINAGEARFYREYISSTHRLQLLSAGVINSTLSSITDLTARIVDDDNGTVLHSTEAKRVDGDPVVSIDGERNLRFEINNATGTSQTSVGARWVYRITDAPPTTGDGTKMYVYDAGNAIVEQYSLSTAFDISTATLEATGGGQENADTWIQWNDVGTKFYETSLSDSGTAIWEYDASSQYDITSLSLANQVEPAETSGGLVSGHAWNSDGSKLFLGENGADETDEYSAGTQFDITSLSYNTTLGSGADVRDIAWNQDGSKFYEVNRGSDTARSYSLSTAFDLSTASLLNTVSMTREEVSLEWSADGSKLFTVNWDTATVIEYDASTSFDLTTLTQAQTISPNTNNPHSIAFNTAPQYQ